MSKLLSHEEWEKQTAPFTYMGLRSKTNIRKQIAFKWIEKNCGDWYYYVDDVLVFGSDLDAAMFRLWAEGAEDDGEV